MTFAQELSDLAAGVAEALHSATVTLTCTQAGWAASAFDPDAGTRAETVLTQSWAVNAQPLRTVRGAAGEGTRVTLVREWVGLASAVTIGGGAGEIKPKDWRITEGTTVYEVVSVDREADGLFVRVRGQRAA